MNESKHTPGPWLAYNAAGNKGRILKNWGVRGCCEKVCTVNELCCSERNYANAHLIAAAPDLLKALILIDTALCQTVDYGAYQTVNGRTFQPLGLVRAAIAKATGNE